MLKPVAHECGSGQFQDQGQGKQQEGELSSRSDILSHPRQSKRLQEKEEKWLSLTVQVPKARATPQSCGNFSGCSTCIANKLRTRKTQLTSPQEYSPLLTSNGRPSPQVLQPLSSVPSSSSPSSFVAEYGRRTSEGPRHREPRFTEIDSASNTLKRRSSRVVDPAPLEPQSVRYHSARPQPRPTSQ